MVLGNTGSSDPLLDQPTVDDEFVAAVDVNAHDDLRRVEKVFRTEFGVPVNADSSLIKQRVDRQAVGASKPGTANEPAELAASLSLEVCVFVGEHPVIDFANLTGCNGCRRLHFDSPLSESSDLLGRLVLQVEDHRVH